MWQANFMSQAYLGIPIAITVEGANALTRSLISFGQVREPIAWCETVVGSQE
jgi:hypothetical protein